MDKENLPSEEFRTPENILQPDVRTEMMGVQSIEKFYENIKSYQLGEHVDEKIRVQFDTIKNLYLHAYFVYRFFPIVSHQLYVTLEHALRECIGEKQLNDFRKSKNKQLPKKGPKFSRGLKLCMTYIVENELIKNEDFSAWQHGKKQRSEQVYSRKISEVIDSKNLDSYEWNEDEIDYENVVYEYDYLKVVLESTTGIRNSLAHGSSMLSPTPIIEFDIASTIINKVYERYKG